MNLEKTRSLAVWVLWAQGLFYFVTAVWPLIDIMSFQAVTGIKTDHMPTGDHRDHWLVNTVALLLLVSSLVYLLAAYRRVVSAEVILLALANPLALIIIDVVYVTRGVIAPIYLLDALAEFILAIFWISVVGYRWRKRMGTGKESGAQPLRESRL